MAIATPSGTRFSMPSSPTVTTGRSSNKEDTG